MTGGAVRSYTAASTAASAASTATAISEWSDFRVFIGPILVAIGSGPSDIRASDIRASDISSRAINPIHLPLPSSFICAIVTALFASGGPFDLSLIVIELPISTRRRTR